MPAIRQTPQQKRDIAFREALARAKARKQVTDVGIKALTNIPPCRLSRYRNEGPWDMGLDRFCLLAQKMGFTGKEVCRIIGVPYATKEDDT